MHVQKYFDIDDIMIVSLSGYVISCKAILSRRPVVGLIHVGNRCVSANFNFKSFDTFGKCVFKYELINNNKSGSGWLRRKFSWNVYRGVIISLMDVCSHYKYHQSDL